MTPTRSASPSTSHSNWPSPQQVGLQVPETLITNDPDAARAFCAESKGRVIYKQLTNFGSRLIDTRVVDDDVLEKIGLTRLSPVIFQAFVEGRNHLRVNVIGNQVFAARVFTDHPGAHADWRLDPLVKIEAAELEPSCEKKILELMTRPTAAIWCHRHAPRRQRFAGIPRAQRFRPVSPLSRKRPANLS